MKRKFQVRFLEGCGAEMPSRLLGGYNAIGWLATAVMTAAAIAMFTTLGK